MSRAAFNINGVGFKGATVPAVQLGSRFVPDSAAVRKVLPCRWRKAFDREGSMWWRLRDDDTSLWVRLADRRGRHLTTIYAHEKSGEG